MGLFNALFGPNIEKSKIEKFKKSGNIQGLIHTLVSTKKSHISQSAALALEEMGAVDKLIALTEDGLRDRILSTGVRAIDVPNSIKRECWEISNKRNACGDAITALGEIKNPRAIKSLIANLRDGRGDGAWLVRSKAKEALLKIGTPAIEPLIKALKEDGAVYVIEGAIAVLKDIGLSAAEPLIPILKTEAESRRNSIIEILQEIGWKPSSQEEKVSYFLATGNIDELSKIGEAATEQLIDALKNGPSDIKRTALEILEKIGWKPSGKSEQINYLIAKKSWDKLSHESKEAVAPIVAAYENSYGYDAKEIINILLKIDERIVFEFKPNCPKCACSMNLIEVISTFWRGIEQTCPTCEEKYDFIYEGKGLLEIRKTIIHPEDRGYTGPWKSYPIRGYLDSSLG